MRNKPPTAPLEQADAGNLANAGCLILDISIKYMFRFAVIFFSFLVSADADPILLGSSPGPEHHFEVLLSTDKDRPEYENLEFKDDSYPMIIVRATATKDILVQFPFPADPYSDMMRLRNHISLDWSSSGVHLAVTARERFYSHLLIRHGEHANT